MPLALLFDLDGTLFDTFDDILAAMNEALEELDQLPLHAGELRPLIGTPVVHQMRVLRGVEGPLAVEVNERYYRHFRRRVDRGVRLYPGVAETMASLSGRALGTFTTRRREVARLMLRSAGIEFHFRAIVGGDEAARPKPHPDLAILAAKSLGLPPNQTIIVGDSPVDIEAGRAAGAWTIAAAYGYGEKEALRAAGPHATIDSFADLPSAVEFVERVARGSER